MLKDIILGNALTSTLLSLQKTSRLIDVTSERLATGLKVNDALDQPQNYFTARALKNRAADFSRLLDGIGQSMRTIEEGLTGTEAIERLLQQAQAVTLEAQDKMGAAPAKAVLKGTVDIESAGALTSLNGVDAGDVFRIIASNGNGGTAVQNITIGATTTAYGLVAQINSSATIGTYVHASINTGGQLIIESLVNDFFTLQARTFTGDYNTMAGLGLGDYVDSNGDGTVLAQNYLITQPLYRTAAAPGGAGLAVASDQIFQSTAGPVIMQGEDGGLFSSLRVTSVNDSDLYTITVNGHSVDYTYAAGADTGITLQHFIDRINAQPEFQGLIEADFLETTGQIIIRPVSGDVRQIEFVQTDLFGPNLDSAFKFNGSNAADGAGVDGTLIDGEMFTFGTAPAPLTQLDKEYNKLMEQIDAVVVDANYRGVNLLGADDLITFFNEDRSNSLLTGGVDFTSAGLGLTRRGFSSATDIGAILGDIEAATERVRNYGTFLSNSVNIIKVRSDFSDRLVNTHQSGADDLTVADQNEEGANLLALQTRQALGATSLSLAAQSQRSVLGLFG